MREVEAVHRQMGSTCDIAKSEGRSGFSPDISAWVRLYEKNLLLLAYGITNDYQLAQDCVQEAFIKAGLKYRQLRNDDNVYQWISRIVINETRRALRLAWNRRVVKPPQLPEEGTHDAYPALEQPEIYKYVNTLPMKLRLPILLYYFNDQSTEEISSVLKISQSACRVRLHRGKLQLRDLMMKEGAL